MRLRHKAEVALLMNMDIIITISTRGRVMDITSMEHMSIRWDMINMARKFLNLVNGVRTIDIILMYVHVGQCNRAAEWLNWSI